MNIRHATHDDLETILDMGEALQEESQAYEPQLVFNYDQARQHYERELSSKDALIIVATDDSGSIVGYQYSFVCQLDYLSGANKECTLEAVYVRPSSRGQGIGKELTKTAEKWATKTKGVNRIKANIYTGNSSSVAIHEEEGFAPYCVEFIKRIED